MQVPSEIHTNQTRTAGMCGTVFVNFIASFIIGQCFNRMLCSMEYAVFFFFAAWMVIMTLYVAFFVPETRNLGVENVMQAWATYVSSPELNVLQECPACPITLKALKLSWLRVALQGKPPA